jgi:mono/diheme cytochrome c family protein
MLQHLAVTACLLALAASAVAADQSKAKITIPVTRTQSTSGQQMYANYCAPCHGLDGRGQGPVAPALRAPVPDLTQLARNNHGRYPDAHVFTVLENGVEMAAHGSAAMPVWGPVLGKMNRTNSQDRMLRISNLSRFLETLQAK